MTKYNQGEPYVQHFDVIVIGSGPGGEGAAMTLSKQGKNVALVEKHHQVGGGCTHWGTIPSKALRHAVQLLADYRHHPLFEHTLSNMDVTYPQLLKTADQVTSKQVSMRQRFYLRNHVEIFHGTASFVDENTVQVEKEIGANDQISADQFVIATGSSPYHPEDIAFDGIKTVDSDSILKLDSTPRIITIYGAGVIGCEYASIFANLDVKVNLVNTRDRLLSFLDDEITDALSYHLRDQGVMIRHNETYESVEILDDGVVLHGQSGRKLKSDVLLWANGRSGNTKGLGLENIGIALNNRGQIEVNETFQSSLPHIYAVGDVIGPPGLASASYDQGRFSALHIAHGKPDWSLVKD
ncbi:MAG: Si-specific NAD(P)(+) transhydrogenase, partial [Gammaproteobacteria bacterium]|nr:Si-specific NAD(P)(+) transhydrogenase [Gammaproteobacteria bacterium]